MIDNGRITLKFQDAVEEEFKFLKDQYLLNCVENGLYCVKYCSKKIFVSIYHERISYEIYIVIGLLPESSKVRVGLEDVVRCEEKKDSPKIFFQASTIDNVKYSVAELASILKRYQSKVFPDKIEYIKIVKNYQERLTHELYTEETMNDIDNKAVEAWGNKEYKKVVEAYSQVYDKLNLIQAKRLEYAKKMIGEN